MITLIGVGHVFDIAAKVRGVIEELGPELVCVELDERRYKALREDHERGSGTLVYSLLARFQERIAEKYDSTVGQEMLAAVDTAQDIGAKIAFIDIEASMEFTSLLNHMTFRERMKFMFGALGGLFVSKKRVEKELKNFEENSAEYLKMFGDQFPTVKKMLIDDRDQHMARALKNFTTQYSNITAVIGDGHVEGIHQLLNNSNIKVQIVRLSQLRSGSMDDITKRLQTSPEGVMGVGGHIPTGSRAGTMATAKRLPQSSARPGAGSTSAPQMYEQEWRGFDEQQSQIKSSQSGHEVSFSFVYANSNGAPRPKAKKKGKPGNREQGRKGTRE